MMAYIILTAGIRPNPPAASLSPAVQPNQS